MSEEENEEYYYNEETGGDESTTELGVLQMLRQHREGEDGDEDNSAYDFDYDDY